MHDARRRGPLAGLRVIEVASIGPGPFCAMMLADLGAEVIKVRRPAGQPFDANPVLDRGRPALALDLKSPRGAASLMKLVEKADGLIEGFRPGVMERLRLGPAECHAVNSRLVYGRMTGWGQEGPLAAAAGHDINYLALSGMLWPLGHADRPPRAPLNLVADFGGGGMLLALGMVAAMLEAGRSGEGQVVDAAMIDGAATLGGMIFGMLGTGGWRLERERNMLDGAAPFYDCYETADGKWVSIGSLEPQFYSLLIQHLDLDRELFAKQWDEARWPAMRAAIAGRFREASRDEWCARLEGIDLCFAPVLDPIEATRHPHALARGAFTEEGGIVQPTPAPRFSRSKTKRNGEEPSAAELLAAWGLEPAEFG